ncbi:hypothetical protein DICVIV_12331 [Dictyocaulus viviparus]|uniref:Uncharacterized protein n=1 Tax=Dictyocaulus viviparus TaxID=29172 RepID=A0A0D8XDI0_DICVI|nr:hypothetical protein DICVIV_12331 [Dictyocaulus viviparus]
MFINGRKIVERWDLISARNLRFLLNFNSILWLALLNFFQATSKEFSIGPGQGEHEKSDPMIPVRTTSSNLKSILTIYEGGFIL